MVCVIARGFHSLTAIKGKKHTVFLALYRLAIAGSNSCSSSALYEAPVSVFQSTSGQLLPAFRVGGNVILTQILNEHPSLITTLIV